MSELELPQFKLNEVETKAHATLSKGKEPMDIEKFFGSHYKDVSADLKYVTDRKKAFAKENSPDRQEAKKLAELFEMLLAQVIELENWLGDDVFIMETSEFDDFKAGVDAVIELLRDGAFSHLGLAIDVTFSQKQVEKKLERIRDEIDYYELLKVKYFVSQGGDFKGELSNIPRVVIAIGRKDINELASLWLDIDFLRKRVHQTKAGKESDTLRLRLREAQGRLANHPLQIEMLAQIESQLEAFARHASTKEKYKKSEKFSSMLAIIHTIRSGKKKIENAPETQSWPMTSYHQIDEALNRLFPRPTGDLEPS